MKNKMTRVLNKLGNKKLKLGKLQDLIYNINNGDKFVKSPSGYYCTNIGKLVYLGILEKNNKREYYISKLGKKNILKPYAKNIEFYKKQNKILSERCDKMWRNRNITEVVNVTYSNRYYLNKYENLQNQLSKILINQ